MAGSQLRDRPGRSTTLVVEDDAAVASMLFYLLEAEGVRCVTTRNAEEGWEAVLTQAPDSAVIDLRLPGQDGWWLLRQIRGAKVARWLPIVVITGFLDEDVRQRAAQLGCECLGKPFTFTALIDKLEGATILANAHAQELP